MPIPREMRAPFATVGAVLLIIVGIVVLKLHSEKNLPSLDPFNEGYHQGVIDAAFYHRCKQEYPSVYMREYMLNHHLSMPRCCEEIDSLELTINNTLYGHE